MNPRDIHIVKPGSKVNLSEINPSKTPGLSGKKADERIEAELLHAENVGANRLLQRKLWAEDKRSLLVVLQGMDCSGKDGTIRHVFGPLNPQGCRVAGFKKPTSEELDHDFLWRVHKVTPRRGEITIFNRSHYEDVLAVRVLNLIPESQWQLRYDHINDFERTLSESGTHIIKIMLHISKDEQKERLQARLDDETRAWKFTLGDLDTRRLQGVRGCARTLLDRAVALVRDPRGQEVVPQLGDLNDRAPRTRVNGPATAGDAGGVARGEG